MTPAPATEAIAIVGIGCRFPGGAANAEAYWDLLESGVDATTEVPADRWSLRRFYDADPSVPGKIHTHRGGYLREPIRSFDARFFGLSPREASPMDPQQRLLLEVAWEAFENAGIVPEQLRGSRTGVYVGGFTIDNKIHLFNGPNRDVIAAHTAVSATLVMLSNRLSYFFDLRGPAMTVDTACSSSLVAIHLAVQALRQGTCDLALAGGVSLMFHPAYAIAMSKGGFLSPDGRCKSFDARGDGYGRGEGAGLLVLKSLSAALRDRDPIHALIEETGVNQDGRTDGITLPNAFAQIALIREVCERAGVAPEAIDYVEAHGTGTVAGDAAEARSLGEALARHRTHDAGPLLIGSAKSNLGHLEAAAGVAGVIKAALAVKKRKIPPSLHFRQPPEGLDLDLLKLEVSTRNRPWPRSEGPARAAVNSFGYGGTNAHALLSSAPSPTQLPVAPPLRPLVLPISARSDVSLGRQLAGLHQVLKARPNTDLGDLAYTLARRRTHHPRRAAIVASSTAELTEQLRQFFDRGTTPRGFVPGVQERFTPSLAFVYTGMGPQSWGMGRQLLAQEPEAAAAFERCDATWQKLAGWSLRELFEGEGSQPTGSPMREPRHAQPANFVLQVMLTETLRAYGLAPAAIVGHSTGEIAAAWAAGTLTLEEAVRVTWVRSQAQQTCLGAGRMMAVALSANEALAELGETLDLAAVNGPRLVTLAGTEADLLQLGERLAAQDIFHRLLEVDVPYHSREMDGLEKSVREGLAELAPRTPQATLFSTVTGRQLDQPHDADYWWRNLRQPVFFAEAMAAMVAAGHNLFLEIGPHPVLAPSILEVLQMARRLAENMAGRCLASLRRGEDEVAYLAGTVAALYAQGVDLDWSRPFPQGNLVPLLSYPWDREELWTETAGSQADRLGQAEHPILGRRAHEAVAAWEGDLSRTFHAYLDDHQIEGQPIFPAAGFVELALLARHDKSRSFAVENLQIHQALASFTTPVLRLHVDGADGEDAAAGQRFAVYSRDRHPDSVWTLNASGRLPRSATPPRRQKHDVAALRKNCPIPFDPAAFYPQTQRRGLAYGKAFQCLRRGALGPGVAVLRLELASWLVPTAEDYYVHPCLLDGALQCALALELQADPESAHVPLPVRIDQVRFHRKVGAAAWCHAVVQADGTADLVLLADDGETLVELYGLHTRRALLQPAEASPRQGDLLYAPQWQAVELTPAELPQSSHWLVFADQHGIAEQLREQARSRRMRLTLVRPGEKWQQNGDHFSLPRGSRAAMDRLLDAIPLGDLAGIVDLWPLDLPGLPEGSAAEDSTAWATGQNDCLDLLHLLQALATRGGAIPPLTVTTVGTQIATPQDQSQERPGQNAVWCALRAARLELPQVTTRLVDFASLTPFVAAKNLLAELSGRSDELEVAYRGSRRWVHRLVRLGPERYRRPSSPRGAAYVLKACERGGDVLRGFVETQRRPPAANEVELVVVVGELGDAARFALQHAEAHKLPDLRWRCLGRVLTLGDEAARSGPLQAGDPVLVLLPQAELHSHLTVPASALVPCRDLAAADQLEAGYALLELGELQPGQWVLVHQADVGAGAAAAQLALRLGARVIATASSAERREGLRAVGLEHVAECESLAFLDLVRELTAGQGVDLVLSSLGGELRMATLDAVCPGGIFVDSSTLVARGGEKISLGFLEAGGRFVRLDLARAQARDPGVLARVQQKLEGLAAGIDLPAASPSFAASRFAEALDACLRGVDGERTVVEVADQTVPLTRRLPVPLVHPAAVYLVTGGFGGVGLEALRWLAAQGARQLVVFSRSGPASPAALALVEDLTRQGIELRHLGVDLADGTATRAALAEVAAGGRELRGLIHCAGLLADAPLDHQDSASLSRVFGPKALGALHLHQALAEQNLDFFVCFSSITATLGNLGQLNYAAANGFLEGLVRLRRAAGLAATCIHLGPVAEVGMAARDARVADALHRVGFRPLEPTLLFAVLEEALREKWACFDLVDLDWGGWGRRTSVGERRRLAVLIPAEAAGSAEAVEALRDKVRHLPAADRRAFLFDLMVEITAKVLNVSRSRIDATSNLRDLGTDSIMAAEISAALYTRTGVRLRILFLMRGPALLTMAETVEEAILSGKQPG